MVRGIFLPIISSRSLDTHTHTHTHTNFDYQLTLYSKIIFSCIVVLSVIVKIIKNLGN